MSSGIPREKAVFCQAMEIDDLGQRRQFLDQACGADVSLRQQVERLLALAQTAGAFFESCAPALEPDDVDAAQVLSEVEAGAESDLSDIKRIGPYKLLQKLGEGGYGVVYMAEQEEPIRRRVALKIIKLGMDTKNVIARFEAERQALALMDHPHIARVLDAGASESGRPYFVMELVYGVKITDYCDQNRVGMNERLKLFVQVCHAVQHAHQKGIIHRDLKPSNIMVTMHDGVPVPKVIDFGIAKATEQRLTEKTLFTSYAQLMGTPAYMSPEQMELSGLNLDTRSDIYSLGVLLYELLTGRTPFDTADLLKIGVEELRRTICEREPLSPSAKLRTLGEDELTKAARKRQLEPPRLVSQLHGDLDWIVLKCLEKDRTRRYATANGLAMDIERYLQEEPVLARPPSRLYRLQKLARRNKIVFLSTAVAMAALLLGAIVSTRMFVKERAALDAEAHLRKDAEAREKASHVALLVTQHRFDEADRLLAAVPLDRPSVDVAVELRTLGDWQASKGRWVEAAARFESLVKVDQLDAPDLVAEDKLKLATAFLKSGMNQNYEQLRQLEVNKLTLTNLALADRAFELALLRPPDTNMLQLLDLEGEAIERTFPSWKEMRPNPPHAMEWTEALTLLNYRAGRFQKALDLSYRCKLNKSCGAARIAQVTLVNAMAAWRLTYYQEAVEQWAESCDLIQARSRQGLGFAIDSGSMFPGASDDLDGSWYEWVMADLLRRECNELISQRDQSLPSMANAGDETRTNLALYALYRAVGEWRAIRGDWGEARRRFDDVLQFRQPNADESSKDYYNQAITLLTLGDKTGFLNLLDLALHTFAGTKNKEAAQHVVEIALLLPNSEMPVASQPLTEILTRTVSAAEPIREGTYSPVSWDLLLLGLLEYRRGNYSAALDLCRRSLFASTYVSMPTVQDRAVMAMCRHKLGDDPGARAELEIANSLVDRGLDPGVDCWGWHDWVFARFLLQEGEAMIFPSAPPPSGPAPAGDGRLQNVEKSNNLD